MLRDARRPAPRLADSVSRSRPRTSRTTPATRSADERYAAPTATTPSCVGLLGSTGRDLVVIHSPRQSPAAHSGLASACVPTDDGAVAKRADRAVPSKAARSTESGFLPAASELSPHLVGHVSASVARPPESSLDDRPGTRFPVLPSGLETIASIRSLRSPRAPAPVAWNRSSARCSLHAPRPSPPTPPFGCPVSPVFVGECASRIL